MSDWTEARARLAQRAATMEDRAVAADVRAALARIAELEAQVRDDHRAAESIGVEPVCSVCVVDYSGICAPSPCAVLTRLGLGAATEREATRG